MSSIHAKRVTKFEIHHSRRWLQMARSMASAAFLLILAGCSSAITKLETWEGNPTTAANAAMSEIHHRMPVIIAKPDWALWLGEEGKGAAPLMQPAPEDALQWHRVSRTVNSNRASGPELIEPIDT